MKRTLTISDPHCGHRVGLTPPGWQLDLNVGEPHLQRLARVQRVYWDFFKLNVRRFGPFDVVKVNGDCIEGKGGRSGGSELITSDREEQVTMFVKCLQPALRPGTQILITRGTPYHTGDTEEFENLIADKIDQDRNRVRIGDQLFVEIEGVMFDLKHHVGRSAVPHTRHTATARERLWNVLANEVGSEPIADVVIRSHVHYYDFCGGRDWLAMTTPALQGFGTKFGRQCTGTVDFGLVVFDIDKGRYSWHAELLAPAKVRAKPVRIR